MSACFTGSFSLYRSVGGFVFVNSTWRGWWFAFGGRFNFGESFNFGRGSVWVSQPPDTWPIIDVLARRAVKVQDANRFGKS